MRYFVTGATGFIGGHVARQLMAGGHEVIALARNPAKAKDLDGVKLAQGDITDKESMRAPMTGVDGVFHIAAWYEIGAKESSQAERINVQGTRNVLDMMKDLNIPRGVYTSTLAVYSDTHGKLVDENYRFTGKHLSEYDRTKGLAHYQVAEPMQRAGLPLIIVQPGLVYGPGDHSNLVQTLDQYLQRKLPLIPLDTAFCWAHADDVARGHILAMEKGRVGENYHICGPKYTLIEALRLAEKITGIPAPRIQAAPVVMKAMSAIVGVVEKVIPMPQTMASETLRIAAGVTYLGDNAKARRELGFAPRPLEEGLRETLEWRMKALGISAK
jgi:nucleoside-diphosphate-sugar epimerase